MFSTLSRKRNSFVPYSVLPAAALLLAGCAAAPSAADNFNIENLVETVGKANKFDRNACDGIYIVVDFADMAENVVGRCVDTNEPVTAIDAFAMSGITVTEGESFPGSICRVAGVPTADKTFTYEGESFTEDCVTMAPEWAYWGLFHESGAGWNNASESVTTKSVKPGESIAFVWQYGELPNPRLPSY